MPKGIAIFGANGCGKTTVGRALADRLKIQHLDAETYFFEPSEIPYAIPRTKAKAVELMRKDIEKTDGFVLSGVTCEYGDPICSLLCLGVHLTVPDSVRFERVERRSREAFGERALPGGDLYEQENRFLEFVKARDISHIEEWAKTLSCPVLHLDGTRPVAENVQILAERISENWMC